MRKTWKRHCYKCHSETRQEQLYKTTNIDTNEVYPKELDGKAAWVVEKTDWLLTECKGCESKNLELVTYHSGENEVEREVSRKSIPGKPLRKVETWIFKLEKDYIELMAEIYSSYNAENHRLTLMGLRTLIDMFILDNIGDAGTFKQKLIKLKEQHFINKVQLELLETSIEAGNAASHRGYKPSIEVLSSVIEIVEHLLKTFVLSKDLTTIKDQIPKRKRT